MNSPTPTIVLDASVVINLLACGDAAGVLKALNRRALVPTQVIDEIDREPIRHPDDLSSFPSLLKAGLLLPHDLEDKHYLSFLELVGAPAPDGLGDGEAATIASAEQFQCTAIIDERKATRIARGRRDRHLTACTLDLYDCKELIAAYSRDQLASLVLSSMKHARMRIPPDRRAWVIDLLGEEAARQCACFPGSRAQIAPRVSVPAATS